MNLKQQFKNPHFIYGHITNNPKIQIYHSLSHFCEMTEHNWMVLVWGLPGSCSQTQLGWMANMTHCHDWPLTLAAQAGLLPVTWASHMMAAGFQKQVFREPKSRSVFVVYCWVTNAHKLGGIKQHPLNISQLLQVGIWVPLTSLDLLLRISQDYKQGVSQDWSPT